MDTVYNPKWVSNQLSVLPYLSRVPPKWCTRMPQDSLKVQILREQVASLLQKRAIEEVNCTHPKRGFFSRLFLVKKRSGGWRPVIDLSRLNQFILCPHFKMETVDSIRLALRKGDWVTSLDLTDAYFHVMIHRRSRRYLRFSFEGKTFQFRALPFGLCVSPYVFSRVLKAVLRHIRLQGIRVHAYLDDWIQPSASEGQSWHHSRKLLSTVLDLGFLPNWDKSELIPVQDFNFLGAQFNLGLALVSPSADRVASFQQAMTKLLGAKEASARQLHSLLGQMESMANLLTLGRAFKRCLQWELKERWSQSSAQWDSKIVLGPWFSNAVRPWTDIDFLKSMSPLHHPVPQLHLFTDSSLEGWGAHMEEHMASGYWSPAWKTQHINVLEMQAVWLSSSSLCGLYQRQFNFAVHRQYDSGSLFESTGRDPLSVSMQYGSGNYVMVCQEQGSHKCQIPARETQCSGRLSEQERECSSDRMVSQSEGSRSSVSALGNPPYRSVRYSSEQEGTNFCISSSRPSSSCIRRSVSELEGDVGIRLPSFSPDSYHAEESARGRVSSLSDSSSMGRTGMVSSASVSSGGSTDPAPSEEGSFVSTGVQVVTPNTSDISSSRLVAMQQHMEASGISRSVARRIYSAKRSSTNALYDYRWKSWVDWCVGREVDPFNLSVNQFGEFLIFLHNKNFSPATVKGYRSAISTTLKQISKIDFSCESILSDVVRSFELERPRTKVHFPKWDLAIVLAALSNAPFEPLEECGFKELTLKTVFLTALASGRRRSEIHALVCSDIKFSEHSVSLGTFPGFLAKNQLPSVLASPIVIPVLKGQDVNTSLCPVRALRIYFNRVFPRRKGRKRLFISHQDSYEKEISVDSISRWIVQTIKLAHSANNVDQVPVSVNAHEVRAIASSWAWSNKVPLDDVVKAGFWSSENSFIRFYLRDTSVLASSLGLIGPVVAAQAVVVPATTM